MKDRKTINEVCKYLNISRSTYYNRVREGIINPFKVNKKVYHLDIEIEKLR